MSANEIQVAGTHYKDKAIQPWDYIVSNNMGYLEGNIIKYVSRWKDKGGLADLKKAQHYLQKLIEVSEAPGTMADVAEANYSGWDTKRLEIWKHAIPAQTWEVEFLYKDGKTLGFRGDDIAEEFRNNQEKIIGWKWLN